MSIWSRLRQLLRCRSLARKLGEQDAPADMGTARTRATGGVPGSPEGTTTTGTGPSEMFVGRVAGDESADTGETGAERRAEAARADEKRRGAASPPETRRDEPPENDALHERG